jgi:hypothetical protein
MTDESLPRRVADALTKRTLMSGAEPREVRGWEEPLEEQHLEPEASRPAEGDEDR